MHSSEGSPEVEPVPLPGSSGEQRITKDQKRKKRKAEETERSRDEDQGSARTPTRPEDAARERERERFSTSVLGKKVFLPRMHHSVFRKHGSFLPPEAEMFHNQRSFSFC